MAADAFHHILKSDDGELLKLGAPASGDVIIKVDPKRTGSAFTMGTETLLPGAAIPVHRHAAHDEVVFVHKGQGRATVEGKVVTVVPGAVVYAPRGMWHGLRNTGTGALQIIWTIAPPGLEEFFRELARLKDATDAASVQAIAARHGVEFHPTGGPPPEEGVAPASGRGRRRHRGRRGRRDSGRRQPALPLKGQGPLTSPGTATAPLPQAASPRPAAGPSRRRRHRQHHRRAGSGVPGAPPQAMTGHRADPSTRATASPARPSIVPGRAGRGLTQDSAPRASQEAPRAMPVGLHKPTMPPARAPSIQAERAPETPSRSSPRARGRHRRGRVKEVYMGGRWVQVTGEGPVIAPGNEPSGT